MLDIIINAIPFPDWISPNVFSIGNFSVKWYGVSYIVGIMLALLYAISCVKNREIWIPNDITRGNAIVPSKQNLDDLMVYTLFGIIVGGRLGSVLLYTPEMIINDPIAIFKIWEGGMAFHGGFAGVCVAVWLFARKTKIELWRVADMAAVGAPLGDAALFGPLTRGMSYSVPMVIIGLLIIVWAQRRPPVAPKRLAETADE